MKRVNVVNPARPGVGRLMVINPTTSKPRKRKTNSSTTKRKKANPSRRRVQRNPALFGKTGLVAQALASAVGGIATTGIAGMLPLPTSPIFNIAAKLGIAWALGAVAEKVAPVQPYAGALSTGAAAVAASDALKIAIPAFRTAYVGSAPVVAQVQETGEPVAIAGYDEFGEIIEMDGLADVIDAGDLGDIIEIQGSGLPTYPYYRDR